MSGRTAAGFCKGSHLLQVHIWVVFTFEHFEDFVDIPIVFVTVLGHSLTTSASRIFARLLSGLVPPSLWQESLAS